MKSDISLAPSLSYYSFPFPDRRDRTDAAIERAARDVLDARAAHEGASLALLYNPLAMPADLVRAHADLDRAVDAAYGRTRYIGDAARLQALFARYTQLVNQAVIPGTGEASPPRRRTRSIKSF